MSFLSRLFGRDTPAQSEPTPTTKAVDFTNAASLGYSLGYVPSHTGTPVTPLSALQVTAAYACVRALSEDVACLPLRVRMVLPDGGAIAQPRHPITRLLQGPNAWQTPFEFISHIITSLSLRGNAYVYIRRASDGTPIELIPLIPDRVLVLVNEQTGMLYYHVSHPRLALQTISAPAEDIVHIRNISLDGGILGLNPIAAAQESLGLAQATQKHAALMFRQGTMLRGILSTDGLLSPEAITNLRGQWEKTYTGNDNSHKVAVLEQGLKFQSMSMTAEDSQLLETRKFTVEEVARLFRVPLTKIGAYGPKTVANAETDQQAYIQDSLMPLCRRLEEAFEQRLLFNDERGRIEIRFDFDHMLRANTKERYEAYQVGLLNGFLNRNEVRAREGQGPITGGDQYYVPLNTAALTSDSSIGAAMTTPIKPKPGEDGAVSPSKPEGEDTEDDE